MLHGTAFKPRSDFCLVAWGTLTTWSFHGFLPGGRDTAGLGGKGGPYRLDAGHTVYQVSEAEKDAVPEEVKRAAREMGQKAFQQR